MEIIQEFGKIAGIAGLGLGVFLFLFKDLIAKSIFPNMTQEQGYKIIRLFMFLVWSIAILGIGLWGFMEFQKLQNNVSSQPKQDIKPPLVEEEKSTKKDEPERNTKVAPTSKSGASPNVQSNVDNKGTWKGDNFTAKEIIVNKKSE